MFRFWKFLKDDSEHAHKKVSLIFIMNQDVDDISCQVRKELLRFRSACGILLLISVE